MFEGEQAGQVVRPRGPFGLSIRLKVRSNLNPWHPLQSPGGQ